MDDSSEPSPFAAFATPRRSAAEEFQERQRRAAQARRRMFGFILSCLVGASGGSTICAAFDCDLDIVLAAVAASIAGSSVGAIIGVVIGAMCFSIMLMTSARGRPGLDAGLAQRDPMAAMRGLMFAWALIGVVIGAAQGALLGVQAAGGTVRLDPLGRWTMVGSILGGAFAIGVWVVALRSMLRSNEAMEPAETT
ncbi:MAG TPA: hypothetical protein VGL71_04140 [Urbifossiella sp.]